MSSRSSWRAAHTWTRNPASGRSSGCTRSTKRRASAAWAETPSCERSGTRAADAHAHRGGHHDGLSHGVHADGPRHVLRLHRALRPLAGVDGQPHLRPDGRARLHRDDQRHVDLRPAVRPHGLRHGAGRPGRQDVLQRPARVPARAGVARRRHAGDLHVLGHRERPGRRGRRADGRHRPQPHAAGGL